MSQVTSKAVYEKPGLNGLMALYEQNYLRLTRLIPEWPIPFEKAVSRTQADRTLHLFVLERTKYTTSIRLTYLFEDEGDTQADPDMELRLFHDASLAEVLACEIHPRRLSFGDFNYTKNSAFDARWARNLFLYKWLDYLLTHGHGFAAAQRPRLIS